MFNLTFKRLYMCLLKILSLRIKMCLIKLCKSKAKSCENDLEMGMLNSKFRVGSTGLKGLEGQQMGKRGAVCL